MKKVFLLALLAVSMVSCTDATWGKFKGLGDNFQVEMLNCNGDVVRTWTSSGKVLSEANSDGYHFVDAETGKLVEVTGTLIITNK